MLDCSAFLAPFHVSLVPSVPTFSSFLFSLSVSIQESIIEPFTSAYLLSCPPMLVPSYFLHPPDNVEDGRYEELIVDGYSHVTWLVKSRGYGADSVAQVHAPQQEQELS